MKKLSKIVFDIYMGIGMVAMAILAVSVMFSVIMRYFFGLSWKEVSEFNILLFAFTTFWGMGINVIKDEHVVIDIFFDTSNRLSNGGSPCSIIWWYWRSMDFWFGMPSFIRRKQARR